MGITLACPAVRLSKPRCAQTEAVIDTGRGGVSGYSAEPPVPTRVTPSQGNACAPRNHLLRDWLLKAGPHISAPHSKGGALWHEGRAINCLHQEQRVPFHDRVDRRTSRLGSARNASWSRQSIRPCPKLQPQGRQQSVRGRAANVQHGGHLAPKSRKPPERRFPTHDAPRASA